ncbi:MAG: hypothetical protein ACE5FS_04655 [Paracoccaceae bacterium]
MVSRPNIELVVHLDSAGDGFAWRDLDRIFGEIDSIAYQIDREEVFQFCRRYRVPELLRDASLERLRRFRNQRVIVSDIRSGSIDIIFTLAATAGFVLSATVGKSALDGYRASRFNNDFREFISSFIDLKLIQLRRKLRDSSAFAEAEIEIDERERRLVAEFRRLAGTQQRPPTIEELLKSLEEEKDLKDR